MDLLSLYRLLLRRKLVIIPMLVLSALAIVYAYTSAPPLYRSTGALALANPAMPSTSEPGATAPVGSDNPYYRYSDLSVIVDILTRQVSSPTAGDAMTAKGLTGTYVVGSSAALSRGPILDVTTEAPSEEAAAKSAGIVLAEIKHQLKDLQDRENTAKKYQIFAIEVEQPQPGTKVFSGTLRRLLMVIVLAGAATLAAAGLADGLVRWRAKRRSAASGTVSPDGLDIDPTMNVPQDTPAGAQLAGAHGRGEGDPDDAWWPEAAGEGAPSTVRRARVRRPSQPARRVSRR